MSKERKRLKRIFTVLLCWALCAANILSLDMTAWANELPSQEIVADENREERGQEQELRGEETPESGTEESEEESETGTSEEPNMPEEPEDGEKSEESEEPETPEEPEEDTSVEDSESDLTPELEDETAEEEAEVPMEEAETADEQKLLSAGIPASGTYENITWQIDAKGKLTVNGTGEFAPVSTQAPIATQRKAPWREYAGSIKSVSINVADMTDASGMLDGLWQVTEVDLKGFKSESVTNMSRMFEGCNSLTSLDLSGLDTQNVTSMFCMFSGCTGLVSLKFGGKFSTAKVTNFQFMFNACRKLQHLDLSTFDTRSATEMGSMFADCREIKELDLRSFDTSHVGGIVNGYYLQGMTGMFSHCESLTKVDVSSFDTRNVTSFNNMFCECSSLEKIDLSSFDTSKVKDFISMFEGCTNLKEVDLSSFDTSSVTVVTSMFLKCKNLQEIDLSNFDMSKVYMTLFMFKDCDQLSMIKTPCNYQGKESEPAKLPKKNETDIWYQPDGTQITELPAGLDYSITITRNKIPDGPHITASKIKTDYECGDSINIDDLTVTWYDSDGSSRQITEYTTNAKSIDMTTPGKKKLNITYSDQSGRKYGASIELTVRKRLEQNNVKISLPTEERIYNRMNWKPVPTVTVDGRLKLVEGTDYNTSYRNNINAGEEAKVVITGINNYTGEVTADFSIEKAKADITASDMVIAIGDDIPSNYAYEVTGLMEGDHLVKEPSFDCDVVDVTKEGMYAIIPKEADGGMNYIITYHEGTLTVAQERVIYRVTFEMMGHGTQIPPIRSVKAGALIEEPEKPVEEGYLFNGWYKDRACTKAWNFNADTVQENTMLYARWTAQTAEGGVRMQEIPNQTYTGSAIKPAVVVYAADGKTLLKSGKDYTVKYYNNIRADQVDAAGGTYNILDGSGQEGVQNRFDSRLPYVEIKGKGNHEGTVYRNFHIDPASISDAAGNPAAGFTLKYSDQLVTNTKKEQKPFSSLKYKKAMKTGEKDPDLQVTLSAIEVYDGSDGSGKQINMWTATGNKENKWNPAIPKGYYGSFRMTVEGTGNYCGKITKTIFVTGKNNLLRNAAITLGKSQKNMPYSGGTVTLTPGYYDSKAKKYYRVNENGSVSSTPEGNGNDLFTVKAGSTYLVYGRDYTVNYVSNRAVGTANMTVTGIGSYMGSKSVTFKITGKAFKANTIDVRSYDMSQPNENDFKSVMPYTGRAVTQNKVTLTTKPNAESDAVKLDYGRHYSISYKNNIKKGIATMTFTAKPESGYSGSFKKTFKIGAVSLADAASVAVEAVNDQEGGAYSLTSSTDEKGNKIYELHGTVPYTKEGAKPSGYISLSLIDGKQAPTGVVLQEGTDYTVSYTNNTVLPGTPNKVSTMTFKGKGNYAGSVKVTFAIGEAAMEAGAENLTVTAAAAAFDSRKTDDYQYVPKIIVKDGKKTLGKKDYTVKYENCSQTEVKTYLNKLAALEMPDESAAQQVGDEDSGSTAWEELQKISPRAVITAAQGSGYTTAAGKEITVYLNIYETKLTGSNLYVVVSGEAAQTTYKGQQVTPEVTVYYGDARAVKAARKNAVTEEARLTGSDYGLTKLTEKKDAAGDYTLTYGVNLAAGKNKGTVTVSGAGKFGGSVTVKFNIMSRNIYEAP
ncbi:MAG: BspA family leucine-rich repeat surface protein [Lachnospiraceae bacterium]|nr:BspA family leucine-rich repeat surface protein [Lachnospiraceae bacterium]